MAAKNKTDLLDLTDREYQKLMKLIAAIPENQALIKDDDETSIKDVIAHRAHWIDLFLGWYRDGQAGKTVHFPTEGYKWSELKRYNANLRQAQQGLDWKASVSALEKGHGRLRDFIQSLDDNQLYSGPMKGAKNNWTTGRWAEAAGPSHYRSAAKYIRARLKSLA